MSLTCLAQRPPSHPRLSNAYPWLSVLAALGQPKAIGLSSPGLSQVLEVRVKAGPLLGREPRDEVGTLAVLDREREREGKAQECG